MHPKTISAEDLALSTGKVLARAAKEPLLIKVKGKTTLVLCPLNEEELVDALLAANPRFRASVRRARRQIRTGKGVPLGEARRRLLR